MGQNAGAGIEAAGLRAFLAGADRDKFSRRPRAMSSPRGSLVGTYGQTVEPPKRWHRGYGGSICEAVFSFAGEENQHPRG